MLSHVLVPLDESALAETALPYALKIVKPDGKITLLSVIDVSEFVTPALYPSAIGPGPVPMAGFEEEIESMRMRRTDHLKTYLQQVCADITRNGLQIEILTKSGRPSETIVEVAKKLNVDAIVMSTHGRSGLSLLLLGSVTHKVLNTAVCPVFVIPAKKEEK